ncbi:MAG: hypothetical protein ACTHM1_01955 [Solirubrobacteraceae bacterium]
MNTPLPASLPPFDVCLLLRADAEQAWLHREVIPVLRELEARKGSTDEDSGAALAYLEAMWSEARVRAHATDTAHGELRGMQDDGEGLLPGAAARYHTAVRVLRELIASRVSRLVQSPAESERADYSSSQVGLAEAPVGGGCAPRAA